jgi:hypothetical protein
LAKAKAAGRLPAEVQLANRPPQPEQEDDRMGEELDEVEPEKLEEEAFTNFNKAERKSKKLRKLWNKSVADHKEACDYVVDVQLALAAAEQKAAEAQGRMEGRLDQMQQAQKDLEQASKAHRATMAAEQEEAPAESPYKKPKKEGEQIWADLQCDLEQALLPIATSNQNDPESVQAAMGKVKTLFNGAWQQAASQLQQLQQQVQALQQLAQNQQQATSAQCATQAVFAQGALPATESSTVHGRTVPAPACLTVASDDDNESETGKPAQEEGAGKKVTRSTNNEVQKTVKLSHGSRERTPTRVAVEAPSMDDG